MLRQFLDRVSFFSLLQRIDVDLAEEVRSRRCPHCSGPLHFARYKRKPRGGPASIPEEFCVRHGLCCGQEGCRKRVLPPSCLFLGRRVYWGAVVLVTTNLQCQCQGLKRWSAGRVMREFGISRKTLRRWRRFFRDALPASRLWRGLRGRLSAEVEDGELPYSLVDHFCNSAASDRLGLADCLLFLSGARGPDWSGLAMDVSAYAEDGGITETM